MRSWTGKGAIRCWIDLAELAERLAGYEWVFRGEPSDSNPLRPGAGRLGSDSAARSSAPMAAREERAALERFKTDALPYLAFTPGPDHDLEWMAVAQHHGMQTRLLDWTESLLIATFFAVESAAEPDEAAAPHGKSGARSAKQPGKSRKSGRRSR